MNIKFLAAALVLFANAAMAQSAFDGFYGQLGIGYASTSPKADKASRTFDGPNYKGTINDTIKYDTTSDIAGVLTLGYMASITDKFLLGVGVEYYHLNGDWNKSSLTSGYSGAVYEGRFKMSNQYNLFISPAYAVDKDKLIYTKFGYTQANIEVEGYDSHTPSGYSLGLGYKQIFTGGWYGFVEGNYFVYGDQKRTDIGYYDGDTYSQSVTNSSTDYNIMVGVGYKF
jgi:outer membrane immunogenic protein